MSSSTKWICDGCQEQFPNRNDMAIVMIAVSANERSYVSHTKELDLCPYCQAKRNLFLKPKVGEPVPEPKLSELLEEALASLVEDMLNDRGL